MLAAASIFIVNNLEEVAIPSVAAMFTFNAWPGVAWDFSVRTPL